MKYIDGLTEDDWAIHQTQYKDKENFRLCDIHCPNQNSPMSTIGGSIFELVNNKYYQFDISILNSNFLDIEKVVSLNGTVIMELLQIKMFGES